MKILFLLFERQPESGEHREDGRRKENVPRRHAVSGEQGDADERRGDRRGDRKAVQGTPGSTGKREIFGLAYVRKRRLTPPFFVGPPPTRGSSRQNCLEDTHGRCAETGRPPR